MTSGFVVQQEKALFIEPNQCNLVAASHDEYGHILSRSSFNEPSTPSLKLTLSGLTPIADDTSTEATNIATVSFSEDLIRQITSIEDIDIVQWLLKAGKCLSKWTLLVHANLIRELYDDDQVAMFSLDNHLLLRELIESLFCNLKPTQCMCFTDMIFRMIMNASDAEEGESNDKAVLVKIVEIFSSRRDSQGKRKGRQGPRYISFNEKTEKKDVRFVHDTCKDKLAALRKQPNDPPLTLTQTDIDRLVQLVRKLPIFLFLSEQFRADHPDCLRDDSLTVAKALAMIMEYEMGNLLRVGALSPLPAAVGGTATVHNNSNCPQVSSRMLIREQQGGGEFKVYNAAIVDVAKQFMNLPPQSITVDDTLMKVTETIFAVMKRELANSLEEVLQQQRDALSVDECPHWCHYLGAMKLEIVAGIDGNNEDMIVRIAPADVMGISECWLRNGYGLEVQRHNIFCDAATLDVISEGVDFQAVQDQAAKAMDAYNWRLASGQKNPRKNPSLLNDTNGMKLPSALFSFHKIESHHETSAEKLKAVCEEIVIRLLEVEAVGKKLWSMAEELTHFSSLTKLGINDAGDDHSFACKYPCTLADRPHHWLLALAANSEIHQHFFHSFSTRIQVKSVTVLPLTPGLHSQTFSSNEDMRFFVAGLSDDDIVDWIDNDDGTKSNTASAFELHQYRWINQDVYADNEIRNEKAGRILEKGLLYTLTISALQSISDVKSFVQQLPSFGKYEERVAKFAAVQPYCPTHVQAADIFFDRMRKKSSKKVLVSTDVVVKAIIPRNPEMKALFWSPEHEDKAKKERYDESGTPPVRITEAMARDSAIKLHAEELAAYTYVSSNLAMMTDVNKEEVGSSKSALSSFSELLHELPLAAAPANNSKTDNFLAVNRSLFIDSDLTVSSESCTKAGDMSSAGHDHVKDKNEEDAVANVKGVAQGIMQAAEGGKENKEVAEDDIDASMHSHAE